MTFYTSIVRPVAFRLDAERAHDLGHRGLPVFASFAGPFLSRPAPTLETELAGIRLASPVGVAPGFSKNAENVGPLLRLGFGYVVAGSILPEPRQGNPRPRLLRDVGNEALLNSLGLPSDGVEVAERNLALPRPRDGAVVANIAAFVLDEVVELARRIEPLVDAVEVALRCPNIVKEPRSNLLDPDNVAEMVGEIARTRTKPLFMKVPSYDDSERGERLDLVRQLLDLGVDGVTVPGTFSRKDPRSAVGHFRVSGPTIRGRTLGFVRDLREIVGDQMAIKALGGITTGRDAFDAIAAGATTVELLTAGVYRGPMIAKAINRELAELLHDNELADVATLRGTGLEVAR